MLQQLVYKNISVIHIIYFSNGYYVFNEFKWINKEKKKKEDKFECFRQLVA